MMNALTDRLCLHVYVLTLCSELKLAKHTCTRFLILSLSVYVYQSVSYGVTRLYEIWYAAEAVVRPRALHTGHMFIGKTAACVQERQF